MKSQALERPNSPVIHGVRGAWGHWLLCLRAWSGDWPFDILSSVIIFIISECFTVLSGLKFIIFLSVAPSSHCERLWALRDPGYSALGLLC